MSGSGIRLFESPEFGSVRAMAAEDGTELFCAKDVAQALGYKNTKDAISKHCKGVAKRYPLETPGGTQTVRFIAEPDVFRLIVGSKLPTAQRFEAWLFEEVLPAIRRDGDYMAAAPDETPEQTMARALLIADATIKRQRDRIGQLEPKARFADAVGDSRGLILVRDMAKLLRQNGVDTGGTRLFERMRADGYIEKRRNAPTQRALELGVMRLVEHTVKKPDGTVVLSGTPKVTPKGQGYFMRRYAGRAMGQTKMDI